MESSATEIIDLRRRLERVENELKFKRDTVNFILAVIYSIHRYIFNADFIIETSKGI
jgi:hypothetical protein